MRRLRRAPSAAPSVPNLLVDRHTALQANQKFYIERLIENADYRKFTTPRYAFYTEIEREAQDDCQSQDNCLGYWLRKHPVNGVVARKWSLLFPSSRSYKSGELPNSTVKIAKKKVSSVQVCLSLFDVAAGLSWV